MYANIDVKREFLNTNNRSSTTSTSGSGYQPRISALQENRLEPRIDIHSIDYEFPLQTKKKESSGNGHLADKNSIPVFSLKMNKLPAEKGAATPSDTAPADAYSEKHEQKTEVDTENIIDSDQMSGMTVTSFIECIRWNDQATLEMHMQAGFKGDMTIMMDSVESNPIEFAMECGHFDALNLLLPQTRASVLMEAMNKRQAFFDQNVDLAIKLFCKF